MKKVIKKLLQFWHWLFPAAAAAHNKKFFFTLQQVKDDLASGKSKAIYYSGTTLWWTHDISDLAEATEIGRKAHAARHKKEMASDRFNREQKARMAGLYNSFAKSKNVPPMDFLGNTLYKITEPAKLQTWIEQAELHPEVFGRNGLDAFMRMHHKNCDGKAFVDWDQVNFDIDGIPAITGGLVKKEPAPVVKIKPEIIPRRNHSCPCGSGKKYKNCCYKHELN